MKDQTRNFSFAKLSISMCITLLSFYLIFEGATYMNKKVLGIFELERRVQKLENMH